MPITTLTKSLGANDRRGWHDHPEAALTFVMGGSMTEEVPAGTLHAARFSLQFKPARMRHTTTIGITGGDLLVVNLPDRPGLPARTDVLDGGVAKALGIGLDDTRRDELEAVVARILNWWPSAPRDDVPDWLLEAHELLATGGFERRPLAHLARRVGRHPVYLARAFRRSFGLSVATCQRRLRLDRAAHRVLATDQGLADLAADCGYADQSHLAHDFRRVIGASASQLRETADRRGVR